MSDLAESFVKCDNCGLDDALEITDEYTPVPRDDTFECSGCGATFELDEEYRAVGLYCRHNRSFDEDCIRCEVEGIDFPA